MFVDQFFLVGTMIVSVSAKFRQSDYQSNIFVNVHGKDGPIILNRPMKDITNGNGQFWADICISSMPWVLCTHGWTESCSTQWMKNLIENFQIHRGGCIICVDYSYFVAEPSFMGYVKAVLLFTPLAARMKHIADSILAEGFSPDSGMLWGMSFGAQLLLHVGKSLGGCIAKGHFCDPAGPGLDSRESVTLNKPNCAAAKDVQVLHTSIDQGSLLRTGLVDWLIGKCGVHQKGATTGDSQTSINPYGTPWLSKNHICCPTIYNWAFNNTYYAKRDDCCKYGSYRFPPPQTKLGDFRMGYYQPDGNLLNRHCEFMSFYGTTLQTEAPGNCSFPLKSP